MRVGAQSLRASTRLVGILGWPVDHSLSPRMHNAAFAALGLDWAYVPLPVRPGDVGEAVRGLVALGFAGANVTIPHKGAVIPFCDEIDVAAEQAESVNTLLVEGGRVVGSSTDGLGVSATTITADTHVLILGAGGAARPVATALLAAGARSVTVAARRPEAAAELAEHLRAIAPAGLIDVARQWPPAGAGGTVLVNATPVKDVVVVEPRADQQVVDLAYRPDGAPTALVAAARAAGCPTVVDGLEFLVRQGAASFERWTSKPAPVGVMRQAVRGGDDPEAR